MIGKLLREHRRTKAIRALRILDTPAEPSFDRFVEQAATAFDAPIALLSFIHDDRQWFKASRGLMIDSIPRDAGFCGHTLDQRDVLEICDPLHDPRFRALPVVTASPHVRYYIGAPLRLADGIDVGALCVLDTRPRQSASADQRAYMLGLARQVAQALDTRIGALGPVAA